MMKQKLYEKQFIKGRTSLLLKNVVRTISLQKEPLNVNATQTQSI